MTRTKETDETEEMPTWKDSMMALGNEFAKKTGEVREKMGDSLESGKEMIEGSVENGRNYVRKRPFTVMAASMAVGIVIGLLLGRKSKHS